MVNRTDELNRDSRNVHSTVGRDHSDDPDYIRMQIERTRAQMGETIEQIQERLSPERLRQQTGEAIREATIGKVEEMTDKLERGAKGWGARLTRTIKENPVPAALIGIGVGWLIASDRNGDDYPYVTDQYYYDPYSSRYGGELREGRRRSGVAEMADESREWVREKTEDIRERAGTAVQEAQDRVSSVAESVEESARETMDQAERRVRELGYRVEETAEEAQARARQGIRRTKQTFWATMNENPLAVGVAAAAVGVVVGAALPSTPVEDRWMGESRDHLVEEAKERVQETAYKVQTVAQEAKEAAMETAKEEAEKQGLRPSSSES